MASSVSLTVTFLSSSSGIDSSLFDFMNMIIQAEIPKAKSTPPTAKQIMRISFLVFSIVLISEKYVLVKSAPINK